MQNIHSFFTLAPINFVRYHHNALGFSCEDRINNCMLACIPMRGCSMAFITLTHDNFIPSAHLCESCHLEIELRISSSTGA